MDDLEIKIAITYKVPENNLTLNGLLRGLEQNRDEIMRAILGRILEALEEKAKNDYPPGHYVLADIYNRLGRLSEYRAELEKGQALEARARKR